MNTYEANELFKHFQCTCHIEIVIVINVLVVLCVHSLSLCIYSSKVHLVN